MKTRLVLPFSSGIACVFALLAGCTSPPEQPSGTTDPGAGQHIDALYQRWGPPANRMTLPNSDRLLFEWRHGACVTNVTTDASGIIAGMAQTGECQRD